eukprot:gene15004-biopygen11187
MAPTGMSIPYATPKGIGAAPLPGGCSRSAPLRATNPIPASTWPVRSTPPGAAPPLCDAWLLAVATAAVVAVAAAAAAAVAAAAAAAGAAAGTAAAATAACAGACTAAAAAAACSGTRHHPRRTG